MAYLAFDYQPGSQPVEAFATRTAATFTPREWMVIELARREGPQSLQPASRLHRLLRLLFGVRVANPLADPRLEALRRAAAYLRNGGTALEPALCEALRAEHYSLDQIAVLAGSAGARD